MFDFCWKNGNMWIFVFLGYKFDFVLLEFIVDGLDKDKFVVGVVVLFIKVFYNNVWDRQGIIDIDKVNMVVLEFNNYINNQVIVFMIQFYCIFFGIIEFLEDFVFWY